MTTNRYWTGLLERRLNRRRALALAATAAATTALGAACSGGSDGGDGATSKDSGGDKPQRGGTLTLSLASQLGNLHPQEVGGSGETRLYVYDHLFNFDYVNGTFEVSAASSIEQPEPTRVVMKINPASRWQQLAPTNGRQLTSEDCKLSWETYRDNVRATGAKAIWTADTDRIETPDAATVVVVLKAPNAWAIGPHGLAGPIPSLLTPKELQGGDLMQKTAVGGGGYHLDQFDPTSGISFVRRPDPWRGERPYIDKVAYKVITDETARAAAFRAHQIDALTARDKLQADEFTTYSPDIAVDRILDSFPRMFWLRSDRAPFSDDRVRQAVYNSLNIKELIDKVDLGQGERSGPIPVHLTTWSLPAKELEAAFPFDVKKAQDLLRAASFDTTKEWTHKLPNAQQSILLAEILQKQLGAAGIKTTLTPEDTRTVWAQSYTAANFDLASSAVQITAQDGNTWASYWSEKWSSGNKSPGKWTDTEIDALLERQRTELDAAKRTALLLEIQRLYLKKFSPGINLYSPYIYAARWKNYHPVTTATGYVGLYGHHSWISAA